MVNHSVSPHLSCNVASGNNYRHVESVTQQNGYSCLGPPFREGLKCGKAVHITSGSKRFRHSALIETATLANVQSDIPSLDSGGFDFNSLRFPVHAYSFTACPTLHQPWYFCIGVQYILGLISQTFSLGSLSCLPRRSFPCNIVASCHPVTHY
jgi:hypothetical protein